MKGCISAGVMYVRSPSGNTALHLAAGNGHLDTVMALVDYGGADVKAEGDWGYSALHFYARQVEFPKLRY